MLLNMIRPVCFYLASVTAAFAVDPTPPDCLAAGYGDTFLEAPRAGTFECHTLHTRPFSSAGAPRVARIIENVRAENRIPAATLDALERGVDAAIMTFSALRNVQLQHVSILAYDGTSPIRDPRGEIQAVTNGRLGAEECTITFYLGAIMESGTEVAIAVAHEIFHCMQYASLSTEQMNTYGAGGDWWVEGVAEALADVALPGSGDITDRSDTFANAVRAQTPLNAMTHQSTPFFQWLIASKGVQGMLAFQANMAGEGSVAAQHGAMRAAMPDSNDWQKFVQAYFDNAITVADGTRLINSAPDLTPLDFSETREEALTPAPFVLRYGDVTYRCGTWRNAAAPTGMATFYMNGVWGDWPDQIEGTDDAGSPMRFAALNTGADGARHSLTATLETPCNTCSTQRVDACLVGNWVMTGGGPIAYMRDLGMPDSMQVEVSEIAMQMLENGGFVVQPISTTAEAQSDGMTITGSGEGSLTTGKWSADDGVLNICPTSGLVSAEASVDGRNYMNFFANSEEMALGYTCDGTTMTTTIEIEGGMPPMQTIYTRQ